MPVGKEYTEQSILVRTEHTCKNRAYLQEQSIFAREDGSTDREARPIATLPSTK
jgi:hypothetical protein